MYTLFDIQRQGVVQVMDEAIGIVTANADLVHVSFDLDVLDPLIAPGTGILSRGGLSYREISYIMQSLGQGNLVGSIDIIEANPLLDIRNQTSELAVELLLSALGGSYGDYERYYLTQGPALSRETRNKHL
jgi:arginase